MDLTKLPSDSEKEGYAMLYNFNMNLILFYALLMQKEYCEALKAALGKGLGCSTSE